MKSDDYLDTPTGRREFSLPPRGTAKW